MNLDWIGLNRKGPSGGTPPSVGNVSPLLSWVRDRNAPDAGRPRPAGDGRASSSSAPSRGALVRRSVHLELPYDRFDPRGERIRALRTELVLRHNGHDGANMIALLSALPCEGRSQIAAELAVAFAQLGRPTLLVDADLRNPVQHELFGADNRRGLSQAISEREPPRLHPVDDLPMSLLTAGSPPANPLELLSDSAFQDLVQHWRSNYEFVVIDTPPVSAFADGLAVAAQARRVVTLVRANSTPYRETRAMLRRVQTTGSSVLGGVISHF